MSTFIPFTSNDEIAAIGRGLMDRTLPKPNWTHAAHFSATIWLLGVHTRFYVARELPDIIRAYNETTGVANTDSSGYHETITQASIRAAGSFLAGNHERPLFEICNLLMESPFGKSEWLLAYWSQSRLFSVEARRSWVEPDIQKLPF